MKKIRKVVSDVPQHWVGDGFPVRSLFSYGGDDSFDPFLLLDYAGPHDFAPAEAKRGVGEHPHRGFETVTVLYQGELEHRDSSGGHGTIGAGDVQWMTAASGIVHEEFHSRQFANAGGTLEMVQLWVNLRARNKPSEPRYQDLRDHQFPRVSLPDDGGTARVKAGVSASTQRHRPGCLCCRGTIEWAGGWSGAVCDEHPPGDSGCHPRLSGRTDGAPELTPITAETNHSGR